jgi:uncharacterized membrane protein
LQEREKRAVVIVLLIVAFAAIRVAHLNHVFWLDESYTAMLTTQPTAEIPRLSAEDVHPPLYFMMLRWWNKLGLFLSGGYSPEKEVIALEYELEKFTHGGNFIVKDKASGEVFRKSGVWASDWANYNLASLWFVRSFNIVIGIGSLLLLYRLGMMFFPRDRTAVLAAMALVCISRYSVFWDTTIRNYSFSVMLVLLAIYLLLEGEKKKGIKEYALLTAVLTISFSSSYVTILFLPWHLAALLILKRGGGRVRLLIVSSLVAGAVFLALWGWALVHQSTLTYTSAVENEVGLTRLMRNISRGLGFYWRVMFSYPPWRMLDASNKILFYPLLIIYAGLISVGIWQSLKPRSRSDLAVTVYVLLPAMVPALINSVRPGMMPFQPRHYYPVLPFLALMLGRALTYIIGAKGGRRTGIIEKQE